MNRNVLFNVTVFLAFTVVLISNVLAQQQKDRAQIKKEIDVLNLQIKQKEVELFAPSQEAQKTFAEFRKQPEI